MRILHVSTFDIAGGAARAAHRLHTALCAAGVDSQMLVQTKDSSEARVHERRTPLARMIGRLRPRIDPLLLACYPRRTVTHWSTQVMPSRVAEDINRLNPDIVHLHWICRGFVPIEVLSRIRAPIVWTWHDSWPFTGGCHVPLDCTRYRNTCGACPQLGSHREADLSRYVWSRKRKHWAQCEMVVVTPSAWLAQCGRSSSLFSERRFEVIPNAIDTERFRPVAKAAARAALNLPGEKPLILFGAMNALSDTNKGYRSFEKACEHLATSSAAGDMEVLVLGDDAPPGGRIGGFRARGLGIVCNESSLVQAYSAADVFVLPSMQENLPNTIMESLACGIPVVAFRQGGIPEMIDHRANGWLAEPFVPEDLADGIAFVLENPSRRASLSAAARKTVLERYGASDIAARYRAVYESVTEG